MAKATKRRARDEEADLSERPRPKKTKPPPPRPYSDDASDAEENDPGHLESQEFLRTTKPQTKKLSAAQPSNLADFHALVEKRGMELRTLVLDKARERQEQDAQLRTSLLNALREGLVDSTSGQDTLVQKATALLTASKTLLDSYASLSEQVTAAASQLSRSKDADGEVTRLGQVIETRGTWVGAQVQRRLSARGGRGGGGGGSLAECEIWERFGGMAEGGGKGEEGMGEGEAWGKAVRGVRRGVRRLVRGLVDEEVGVE